MKHSHSLSLSAIQKLWCFGFAKSVYYCILFLIFFSRFPVLYEDRLSVMFCDFVELKMHESTMTYSAWEHVFQVLIKCYFLEDINNECWMMNDERRTAFSIVRHQIIMQSKQCGIPIETINRSNDEDILCMLNVECWDACALDTLGAVYELLIFANYDDDDDTHPLMLINRANERASVCLRPTKLFF